jgi:hypothetical protein
MAVLGAILLAIGAVMMSCDRAKSQEHMHGQHVADANWYDEACCDNKDCRVIDSEEIWFEGDKLFWKSKRSGKLHVIHRDARMNWKQGQPGQDLGPKIRMSQDGQYHGCEYPTGGPYGIPNDYQARCVYLPTGM